MKAQASSQQQMFIVGGLDFAVQLGQSFLPVLETFVVLAYLEVSGHLNGTRSDPYL